LEKRQFRILPVTPRRLGLLSAQNQVDAGLFSLVDYFSQKEEFDLLNYCIATRDQVQSVLLFSNHGWRDLEGKRIGITDDTATSVKLLKVLLEKKHGVTATFARMHSGVNDLREFDAVLLIGDEALRSKRHGLAGFELVYDLATEWYQWKKLPFVFAVWAVKKSMPAQQRDELSEMIALSLESAEEDFSAVGTLHGKKVGLNPLETSEYLGAFNYRLGERERAAMESFRELLAESEAERIA
jgi:chorismate dehydratase